MSKMSRDKGKAGEREWSKKLSAAGFPSRRGQQFAGGTDAPDVVSPALDFLHPEVKRVERLNLRDAMDQAIRDAGPGQMPYVAHRRNHSEWMVTMRADNWLELVREYVGA